MLRLRLGTHPKQFRTFAVQITGMLQEHEGVQSDEQAGIKRPNLELSLLSGPLLDHK